MTDNNDTAHDDGTALAERIVRDLRSWVVRFKEIYGVSIEMPIMFEAADEIERLVAANASLRAEDDAQWKVQCSHCGHLTIGHSPHHFQNIIADGGIFSRTIDMSDNLPDDGS